MLKHWILVGCLAGNLVSISAQNVTMEALDYSGRKCIRLSNGQVELVAATQMGPRILRFGFVGGQNLLSSAGHRLWHAPEDRQRTYGADNQPVEVQWDGKTLSLTAPVEKPTGIQKAMRITLAGGEPHATVTHQLVNHNLWAVELAPWALSVTPAGGRAIFPQEPYRPHADYLLPARSMVLWHYTDMRDPRWIWGTKYIQLKQDSAPRREQKFGLLNTQGWLACVLNDDLFLKRYGYDPKATYPDLGCNTEAYTDRNMLELETLGPKVRLEPNAAATHVENWFLYRVPIGENEDDVDRVVLPLVRQTNAPQP